MKETRDRILPKGVGVLDDGSPEKPRVRAGDAYAVRAPLEVISADELERQYGRKSSGSGTRNVLMSVLVNVEAARRAADNLTRGRTLPRPRGNFVAAEVYHSVGKSRVRNKTIVV